MTLLILTVNTLKQFMIFVVFPAGLQLKFSFALNQHKQPPIGVLKSSCSETFTFFMRKQLQ